MQLKQKAFYIMLRSSLLPFLLSFAVLACSSNDATTSKRSVAIAGGKLSWNDFLQVSDLHRTSFPQPDGQSIYMFNFSTLGAIAVELSDGRSIQYDEFDVIGSCASQTGAWNEPEAFEECQIKMAQALAAPRPNPPGKAALITLSEQAVREEGSCQWVGYDPSLDRQVRMIGSLARLDDDRFFFARLRCV